MRELADDLDIREEWVRMDAIEQHYKDLQMQSPLMDSDCETYSTEYLNSSPPTAGQVTGTLASSSTVSESPSPSAADVAAGKHARQTVSVDGHDRINTLSLQLSDPEFFGIGDGDVVAVTENFCL